VAVAGTGSKVEQNVEAPYDCSLCPRLSSFVRAQRLVEPTWYNGPVRSFGSSDARLLIVGLAPGLKGANRTGRPFTGDFAGNLLYGTLLEFGFASGTFDARADDGLQPIDTMITNAVRCVPPENKPTPAEINTCRRFLDARIAALPRLQAIVALGRIAHDSVLVTLGQRRAGFAFAHGARHELTIGAGRSMLLYDSYHCSRYNTNTGRLTADMFRDVFRAIKTDLDADAVSAS
jgi:uracil-DNA glycosylase